MKYKRENMNVKIKNFLISYFDVPYFVIQLL